MKKSKKTTRQVIGKTKRANIKVALKEEVSINPLNLRKVFLKVSKNKKVSFSTVEKIWYKEMRRDVPCFMTISSHGAAINTKSSMAKLVNKKLIFDIAPTITKDFTPEEKVAFVDIVLG